MAKIRVTFFFAWYDLWVGAFWDQKRRALYLCPLPCCVIRIEAASKVLDLAYRGEGADQQSSGRALEHDWWEAADGGDS